jgi:hypothetical protein
MTTQGSIPSHRHSSGTYSRRRFLRDSAVATAAVFSCPAILKSAAPNSTLQVACIGVGGMGGSTMKAVASHPKVKITALCDVDAQTLGLAEKSFPDASKHRDWRELLSSHADKFDAVTVGTPDHMHAAPAVLALRAKKHVYLQKPMAPTLHECRVITQEATKAGVVTQLGNQGRSSIESRMAVELVAQEYGIANEGRSNSLGVGLGSLAGRSRAAALFGEHVSSQELAGLV